MSANTVVTSSDQPASLDAKLRPELEEVALQMHSDERKENVVLYPDSRLWVKRQNRGEQIEKAGMRSYLEAADTHFGPYHRGKYEQTQIHQLPLNVRGKGYNIQSKPIQG